VLGHLLCFFWEFKNFAGKPWPRKTCMWYTTNKILVVTLFTFIGTSLSQDPWLLATNTPTSPQVTTCNANSSGVSCGPSFACCSSGSSFYCPPSNYTNCCGCDSNGCYSCGPSTTCWPGYPSACMTNTGQIILIVMSIVIALMAILVLVLLARCIYSCCIRKRDMI